MVEQGTKAAETRRRHKEAREAKQKLYIRMRDLIESSMLQVLEDPTSSPGERVAAADILLKVGGGRLGS